MKIVVIRNILLLLIWMTASVTMAQVVVESKLDTAEIRIGEQVQIQVKVTAGQSQRVVFPQYEKGQNLTPGVEVLVATRVDTTLLNAGRRQAEMPGTKDFNIFRLPQRSSLLTRWKEVYIYKRTSSGRTISPYKYSGFAK